MLARELRYDWFSSVMQSQGYEVLFTAHHLDDQLETFIINLSRGTGLNGLLGIPQINGYVHRPLLNFSRAEILKYAENNNIDWREDQSNQSDKYLRNNIRHKIVPELKLLNENLLTNFQDTLARLEGSVANLNSYRNQIKQQLLVWMVRWLK